MLRLKNSSSNFTIAQTSASATKLSHHRSLRQLTSQISCGSVPDVNARWRELKHLARRTFVFTLCQSPKLVNSSFSLLRWASSTRLPAITSIVHRLCKYTFLAQFVGAESAEGLIPLIKQMRQRGQGAIINYSAEIEPSAVDPLQAESLHLDARANIIQCLNTLSNLKEEARPFLAIKLSGLLKDPNLLSRVSNVMNVMNSDTMDYNALIARGTITGPDKALLQDLQSFLNSVCSRARMSGLRIMVDAEYFRYQPAIDCLTISLAQEFNDSSDTVFMTLQTSLRRSPAFLVSCFKDARDKQYKLCVKLVRGAYVDYENGHTPAGEKSSVWSSKQQTDDSFNLCARTILDWKSEQDDVLSVVFATHNEESCAKILSVVRNDAAAFDPRYFAMATLYGMKDSLSERLAGEGKFGMYRYVPYGPQNLVIPYLVRRAEENKSVLMGKNTSSEITDALRDFRAWSLL